MAYATAGLRLMIPRVGASGPALWTYETTDAHTDVDGTDYFTDAEAKGVKTGDIVIVIDTDAPSVTLHRFTVDADGNGTASAATLA